MSDQPQWFRGLPDADQARVVVLMSELVDLADQIRRLGEVAGLDISLWDSEDRGSAIIALQALASHARETAALQLGLADAYDRLGRTISGE